MRKIPSLFKRNYDGDRLVRDEVVEGSEWVLNGEGLATVKWDGTACMMRDGVLFKRFDRKRNKRGEMKPAPKGWEPCEAEPNEHTGHWPGWVPIGGGDEDRWFRETPHSGLLDGTYELTGPKIQGNPYERSVRSFKRHGFAELHKDPRTYEDIRKFLDRCHIEGIVWHHPDGRMVKIKRKDFGFTWPPPKREET